MAHDRRRFASLIFLIVAVLGGILLLGLLIGMCHSDENPQGGAEDVTEHVAPPSPQHAPVPEAVRLL